MVFNRINWELDVELQVSEAATGGVLSKKVLLKILQNFTEKFLCQSFLFAGLSLQLYLKRDSGTGAFVWILLDFYLRATASKF